MRKQRKARPEKPVITLTKHDWSREEAVTSSSNFVNAHRFVRALATGQEHEQRTVAFTVGQVISYPAPGISAEQEQATLENIAHVADIFSAAAALCIVDLMADGPNGKFVLDVVKTFVMAMDRQAHPENYPEPKEQHAADAAVDKPEVLRKENCSGESKPGYCPGSAEFDNIDPATCVGCERNAANVEGDDRPVGKGVRASDAN